MPRFTISTTWLGPAAAMVSGGWTLPKLLLVFMPSTLTPSVTDGVVRSSSFSTDNLTDFDFLRARLFPPRSDGTAARRHTRDNQFRVMMCLLRKEWDWKQSRRATEEGTPTLSALFFVSDRLISDTQCVKEKIWEMWVNGLEVGSRSHAPRRGQSPPSRASRAAERPNVRSHAGAWERENLASGGISAARGPRRPWPALPLHPAVPSSRRRDTWLEALRAPNLGAALPRPDGPRAGRREIPKRSRRRRRCGRGHRDDMSD